jgi:excisionase family DNA binding protein
VSGLLDLVLDELAADPVALERLRQLVRDQVSERYLVPALAFTVATLAAELGRSERSIRAAIARGELEAVKRGRGYVISADAVADWARAPVPRSQPAVQARDSRRRSASGAMARGLRDSR